MRTPTCERFATVHHYDVDSSHLCYYTILTSLLSLHRIIGTLGRLMHVIKEMNLKLQNVEYVVFDEADR